ncbi:hypothetical protein GCM10007424_01220 [Flavobacterium suaedae]|uniref:Carboxypeptidase regulatory-like domain-containing protein n=1 Tax=Flavobacterium suaedae TaxID=1767027 RepID=A0ABQ1JC03_9FLAO|nr:hypothetical protein [Flavobacterium suaedae]GGB65073.1 hypothetical protein GCM10007424_01220 [Flavobacterium suaedae]
MNKTILLLIFAFSLCSCGIDYDGKTKIIFEGNITDYNGSPLPNITVGAKYYNGNITDIAGFGETDSNGNFRIIFPGTNENVDINILINHLDYMNNYNKNSYSTLSIGNITQSVIRAHDYKINFSTIQLYDLNDDNSVNLRVNINKTSSYYDGIIKVNIIGIADDNYIDYDFDNIPSDSPSNYNAQYDANLYYEYSRTYLVAKNQTIKIKYMLSDYSVHETEVYIGEESVERTITY